jgi:putative hemolysin
VKNIAIIALTVGVLLIAACGGQPAPAPTEQPQATAVPPEPTPTQAAPTAPAPTSLPTIASPSPSPTEEPLNSPLAPELPTDGPFDSPLEPADDTFQSPIGLANPASVYCQQQGHHLEMRTSDAGTTGYCIFPDGTECEEWAYFRGECAPGTPAP